MSVSLALLAVAVLTALIPMLAVGPKPPASLRHLEKSFVLAVFTLVVGSVVFHVLHGLTFFSLAHLGYLLAVVTAPTLLLGWFALAVVRRRQTLVLRGGALLGLALVGVGVWATHIEPNWLRTDVVQVAGPVQRSFTIGVLADLQTPNVGPHEWNAVHTLIASEPDLVLIPGDLFQGPPTQISAETPNFVALLQALGADGAEVAIVSGDSDFVGQLAPMAAEAGALLIDNSITEICLLYTSPSPRDATLSRMPSSA